MLNIDVNSEIMCFILFHPKATTPPTILQWKSSPPIFTLAVPASTPSKQKPRSMDLGSTTGSIKVVRHFPWIVCAKIKSGLFISILDSPDRNYFVYSLYLYFSVYPSVHTSVLCHWIIPRFIRVRIGGLHAYEWFDVIYHTSHSLFPTHCAVLYWISSPRDVALLPPQQMFACDSHLAASHNLT